MINNKYPNISPSLNLDFTNSNTIDPRITFSRASAATYYDGKTVAKAEENLLTHSQEFDNLAWTKANSTVTPNAATAPDGTVTAALVYPISSGARSIIWQAVSSIGRTYTYSIYAKYSGKQWVSFQTGADGTLSLVWWDVLNGVMGATNGQTAYITPVGNGWYRLILTRVADGVYTNWTVCDSDGSDVATVSGTNGVLFWGAQTEERAQVTAYTPTTTQPITNYIPVLQTALSGVPRIDHDPVTGECKGLLIEEQRTNLLTYSEQFDNAAWGKNGSGITPNTAIAPDGTLSADTFVVNQTSPFGFMFHGSTIPTGVTTSSIYAKKGSQKYLQLLSTATSAGWANFDLEVGTAYSGGTASASIVSVGDGWYRCVMSINDPNQFTIGFVPSLTSPRAQTSTLNTFAYIWGAQLEVGSFPTSYIKTEASQVTRAADSALMTGANFSSWYRQGEGTLFSDAVWDYGSDNGAYMRYAASLFDVSNANSRIAIYNYNGAGGAYIAINNVGQAAVDGATHRASPVKSVIAYALNNSSGSVNGYAPTSNTNCLIPSAISALTIGAIIPGISTLNGHIKRITYYPKRLPDAQLQALTV